MNRTFRALMRFWAWLMLGLCIITLLSNIIFFLQNSHIDLPYITFNAAVFLVSIGLFMLSAKLPGG